MTTRSFRIPAVRARSSRPRLVCSTLAALALGLAGAAHAAKLAPMFRHQPPSSRAQLHNPPPRISIYNAYAVLQKNCSNSQPIFIAHIALSNSGGPLAAHQGLVYVSEDNNSGTYKGLSLRLVSQGSSILGIEPGKVLGWTIPIKSLAPYSAEVGKHLLTVHVRPTLYAGKPAFAAPPDLAFYANVPWGFCGRRGIRLSSPLHGPRLH